MRRLLSFGLVFGGGAFFSFSTIGEFLSTRAPSASVFVIMLGLLTAMGYLSSQRLLRNQGVLHAWSFNEILLTIGYGLLAACAPLAAGFYSPQLNIGLDGTSSWTWWPAAIAVALACVVVNAFQSATSRILIATGAIVSFVFGVLLVGGVIATGGFHGNHVRYLLVSGSSLSDVIAGFAVAVPFFFGAEALITQSADMQEHDRSFSRPALIALGFFLVGLQYAGVAGSDGGGSLPIDAPSLTGAYVGHAFASSATAAVFISSVGASFLFAYLFAERLAQLGLSLRARVGILVTVLVAPVIISMGISTRLQISSHTGTYAAMTLFLNLSAVAGLVLALGLAFGCVKALRLVVHLRMDSMEFIPPTVGLIGLGVAMLGYLWHRTTTSTWSHPELMLLIVSALLIATYSVSRRMGSARCR